MSKQLRIWLFVLLGTLLTSTSLLAEGVITMTTTKSVGTNIFLTIIANGPVSISGARVVYGTDGFYYILNSTTVTIRGDVTELDCSSNQLTYLDVSGCTALTELNCQKNRLTSLDVSKNTALTELDCSYNQLTSLNLSDCTALTKLYCFRNQLTSLNLSDCTALTKLYCYRNQLTSLDVSGCSALTTLSCSWNQLTSLDVSGCTALTTLDCYWNQLTSLDVSGCTALTELKCYENQLTSLDVSSCTALTTLDCYWNQLTSLDVSGCTALTELNCQVNQLTSLDVSGCTALTTLNCKSNQLTSLEVSGCTALTELDCSYNQLTSLDVSGCTSLTSLDVSKNPALTTLDCSYNRLTSLKARGCSALTTLDCSGNQLTKLDLSGKTALTTLDCSYNRLTSLDVSGCTALTTLECQENQLTSLDLSSCPSLTELDCSNNQLTSLDVSGCTALTELKCYENQLTSLDVSSCTALTTLDCSPNRLTSLDVSGCTALTTLSCSWNPLTSLDVSKNTALTTLYCNGNKNKLTSLDVSGCTALTTLACSNNRLTSLDVSGCSALTELNCSSNRLTSLDVSMNPALTELKCYKNQLSSLDVSKNTALEKLFCYNNQLTSLDVSGCSALTTLSCSWNPLTSLDVSGCTVLTTLDCYYNQLTSLDVSGCTALTTLACSNNRLTSLPLSACISLTYLDCYDNQLTSLDVSDCRNLESLNCTRNKIKSAEMSQLINSLPNRRGYKSGSLTLVDQRSSSEKNFCYQYDIEVARNKNWSSSYPGAPNRTCSVTKTLEGKGSLSITGAADLGVVAYGTMLTVVATPEKNYELVALTANGVDITATKKFLVKDDVIVKAVFKGDDFKVSLAQDGEGDLSVTGVDNLDAVPYGTELTVVATPADGYKLTKLTANGQDILETKCFKVTENTRVEATFRLQVYNVTPIKLGEGTLYVSGADDLDAVTPGSELTITATPAEGYELTELTANGHSILDTKRVVVNEDMIIKAIFIQKTFKVSLTKHGKGTIRAIGADNLDAVPYGTELTIEATPAAGYELQSLVAGGVDITATKKIVVKDNLTVKATFAKKSFAVTFAKEGEGTITATGASNLNSVAYGTELTINATPAEGYELTALTANGTDILASQKVTIKEAVEVKATFTKKNFVVTLEKAGEGELSTIGTDNLKKVPYGTELTIIATPAEGYELTSIVVDGVNITDSKKIVVKDNKTVKATFSKKSFAVSLTKEGEGTITATGASNLNAVAYGTELTIVATPAAGYELVSITANGTDITASKKVVVTDNLTVKATFAKKSFAVSLTKEGEGTITATGASNLNSVAYGTELTINATPAEGYELQSLVAGGVDITATKKIVVKGNLTVKATFAKKSFAVSLTKEGEGMITATGASNLNSVAYGTELTIVATPAEGYELTALTANGTDILATKKVVVEGNLTVKATFAKKNFAVSLTKEGEGTITATGASNLNSVAYGTELTINATPAEGYELTALTSNGTDILATKKVVVEGNLTVKATFTKKSFAVSLTKEGEGTISATGASNLNSVAYGTELTINATPADGYELTALTANGKDILATKKIVVTDNMTVKATFTKKTFAVTLTSNEHGDITIVEPVDLKAVPYGTTLTVKATGKNAQCVLTELTANGKDILATQSFVVTDVTEVKATFVDHTGVETTVTQQTQLYPNPATDYVIVEGVAPASEVTLHSMTGERLYAGRADDRGTLQIDLTPYADGVYLVCVAGETYRVVVRH